MALDSTAGRGHYASPGPGITPSPALLAPRPESPPDTKRAPRLAEPQGPQRAVMRGYQPPMTTATPVIRLALTAVPKVPVVKLLPEVLVTPLTVPVTSPREVLPLP